MRVSLYCLKFPAGLHIAPHELSLDETLPTIPSDTLFSALVHGWLRRGGDPNHWLEPFVQSKPPFLLTSAFPWVHDQPWFPKPLSFQPSPKWQALPFLPEPLFFRVAKGKPLDEPPPELEETPWEVEQIPRVSLDRITLRSNLFHIARVRFPAGCGLWFGVAWLNHEMRCGSLSFREALELALAELTETGIGGDRGLGYGRFSFQHVDDVTWPDPVTALGVLLSRLWPKPKEVELLRGSRAWRLTEVGGFAETAVGHVRRLRVRLVAEGSVVPSVVKGGLVNVAPEDFAKKHHPIWRYGLAFLYPWEVDHGP